MQTFVLTQNQFVCTYYLCFDVNIYYNNTYFVNEFNSLAVKILLLNFFTKNQDNVVFVKKIRAVLDETRLMAFRDDLSDF